MKHHMRRLDVDAPRILDAVVPFALAALALATLCASGCGGGGGAILGKEPVKKVVKVENNVDALRAWGTSGAKADVLVLIDPNDGMAAFPAGVMSDLESAARRLARGDAKPLGEIAPLIERGGTVSLGYMAGMYKRVIWVIPSARPIGETPVEEYKTYFIQRRQFPAAAVADFKADGKYVTGTLLGVPLTITRLDDLALGPEETAIVDIDLYYFLATKAQDPGYRTGTTTLLAFLRELGSRGVKATLVTVTLSNQSNMVPMDLRYYGDVIVRALTEPRDLNGPLPDEWRYMIDAEDSLSAKRYASAAAIYGDLSRKAKDDPGLYFSLAMAEGFQDKGPEARAALLDAYRLLAADGKVSAGYEILDTPDLAKTLAPADMDYQRGLFYYTAHRPFDAITYLVRVAQQRPKEFGLFTILFRAYREAGDERGESWALQKLIGIDDGRVRREMPWVYADLGGLYDRGGYWVNASQMYEKYMQVHPGDSLSKAFEKRIAAWKAKGLLK
jgi:hypothetical protein